MNFRSVVYKGIGTSFKKDDLLNRTERCQLTLLVCFFLVSIKAFHVRWKLEKELAEIDYCLQSTFTTTVGSFQEKDEESERQLLERNNI